MTDTIESLTARLRAAEAALADLDEERRATAEEECNCEGCGVRLPRQAALEDNEDNIWTCARCLSAFTAAEAHRADANAATIAAQAERIRELEAGLLPEAVLRAMDAIIEDARGMVGPGDRPLAGWFGLTLDDLVAWRRAALSRAIRTTKKKHT